MAAFKWARDSVGSDCAGSGSGLSDGGFLGEDSGSKGDEVCGGESDLCLSRLLMLCWLRERESSWVSLSSSS